MKLKIDEDLGSTVQAALTNAGHEVHSVPEEGLEGASDPDVIAAATREERCLVTVDREFGNPFLYPPEKHAGIVVLRLQKEQSRTDLLANLRVLIDALGIMNPKGKLWVIQHSRLREYRHPPQDIAE